MILYSTILKNVVLNNIRKNRDIYIYIGDVYCRSIFEIYFLLILEFIYLNNNMFLLI